MKIDLAEDLAVKLKCGCTVRFIGSRGHKLTGFSPGCTVKGTTVAEQPDAAKRLDAYDRHRTACVNKAKRMRATMMEEIDTLEASGVDTDEPPE